MQCGKKDYDDNQCNRISGHSGDHRFEAAEFAIETTAVPDNVVEARTRQGTKFLIETVPLDEDGDDDITTSMLKGGQ